jgi:hypothetical protein
MRGFVTLSQCTSLFNRSDFNLQALTGEVLLPSVFPALLTLYMQHPAAYTTILVNHDQQHSQLQVFDSYLPQGKAPKLIISRGDTKVCGAAAPAPKQLVESAGP